VTFQAAALRALGGSIQLHALLSERVSPHLILQDRDEEITIRIADTPLARAILILQECYADRAECSSAFWRLRAIGPLLEQPELAPWIRSRTAEGREIEDAIFFVAATAPLTPQGTFHVGAFCALLRYIQPRAAAFPDLTEETPDV
jgi:hypothetical protein